MGKFSRPARIAETEFSEIVLGTQDLGHKLRVYLIDKSFIDVFFTEKTKKRRYSIHWERQHLDGTIYRLDNTPDPTWSGLQTFPVHFHEKKYERVKKPPFEIIKDAQPEELLRLFLLFAQEVMTMVG